MYYRSLPENLSILLFFVPLRVLHGNYRASLYEVNIPAFPQNTSAKARCSWLLSVRTFTSGVSGLTRNCDIPLLMSNKGAQSSFRLPSCRKAENVVFRLIHQRKILKTKQSLSIFHLQARRYSYCFLGLLTNAYEGNSRF